MIPLLQTYLTEEISRFGAVVGEFLKEAVDAAAPPSAAALAIAGPVADNKCEMTNNKKKLLVDGDSLTQEFDIRRVI
jgi:glucokinase